MTINKRKLYYVLAFYAVNMVSSFLLTSDIILKNLSPYPRTLFMVINSFFGDFGFYSIFVAIAIIVFRTDYSRARFLEIASIIFSIIFFAFSIYFKHYNMFFSFANLSVFSSPVADDTLAFILDSLLLLLTNAEFIFLVSSVIMICLFIIIFKRHREDLDYKHSSSVFGKNRIIIGFGLFMVGVLLMASSLSVYRVEIENTWHEDNSTSLYGSQSVGLFNYYIYEGYAYFSKEFPELSQNKFNDTKQKLKKYENNNYISPIDGYELDNLDYFGVYEGKNLILIQLESFNNFLIGLEININGEYKEVTPNINRIAKNSLYFNNYYTSVGIGNTSDSEFTTLTGIYPIGNDYIIYNHDKVKYPTIADMFNNKNYYTYSSHANTDKFYERGRVHTSVFGFKTHIGLENLEANDNNLIHSWISDYDFLEQNINIFNEKTINTKVFAHLITITSHMPYKKPNESKGEEWFFGKNNLLPNGISFVENKLLNQQIVGYLEHVSYTDYAIGNLLNKIEQLGLAEDTIIMFYGDHGCDIDIIEMFYENRQELRNEINPMIQYINDENDRIMQNRLFMANIPFIIYETSNSKLIEPKKIELVRGTSSTTRTIANLFALSQDYYFGVNALSNSKTYVYNPRNLDIYADGIIINAQSRKYFIVDKSYQQFYTEEKIEEIIKNFLEYKDFNDKLIRYRIFPKLN